MNAPPLQSLLTLEALPLRRAWAKTWGHREEESSSLPIGQESIWNLARVQTGRPHVVIGGRVQEAKASLSGDPEFPKRSLVREFPPTSWSPFKNAPQQNV